MLHEIVRNKYNVQSFSAGGPGRWTASGKGFLLSELFIQRPSAREPRGTERQFAEDVCTEPPSGANVGS